MKRKVLILSTFLLIIGSFFLGACGSSTPPEAQQTSQEEKEDPQARKIVGISLPTEASARWVSEGEIMKAALDDLGYEVQLLYADNKTDKQLAQIQEILTEGVNILVITPVDTSVFSDLLDAAHRSGVLVIAYDRLIMNTKDVDFLVTYNHTEGGVLLGKQIEQSLDLQSGKGPYNLELFAGDPADPVAKSYYDGSMSILKPYIDAGQLTVQSQQVSFEETAITDWIDVTAQVRMNELLVTYYQRQHVDVILSPSDHISLGILSTLKKAGYGDAAKPLPLITGVGADVEAVKSMLAGELRYTLLLDYESLAKQTALMVDSVLKGNRVPFNNTKSYYNGEKFVPTLEMFPVVINLSNYQELLIDSEYYSAEQINELSEK